MRGRALWHWHNAGYVRIHGAAERAEFGLYNRSELGNLWKAQGIWRISGINSGLNTLHQMESYTGSNTGITTICKKNKKKRTNDLLLKNGRKTMKKKEERDLFFFHGGITGVINACICSLGFVLVDEITTMINSVRMDLWQNYEFNLTYIGLATIVSSLVSFFPAFVGGCLLATWIKLDTKTGHITYRKSVGKGMLVGALFGGLVCFFVGVLLFGFMLASGKGSLSYFPLRAIEAITFAILAGGLTGRKLMFLTRDSSDEHKNDG